MAYFWRYWRITPREYRELTVEEHTAMVTVMKEVSREQRRAANKRR